MKYFNRFFLTLLVIGATVSLHAQSEYISNSPCMEEDRIEDLNGNCGLLILSKHSDLVISVTNAKKKPSIRFNGERPDGYYETCIVIDADDTRNPKVEISRRGSVYHTDVVQKVKPDFCYAYRIHEVMNPIRKDDQTKANDVHLNAAEAALEFTTTIKDLKVECAPGLGAKVSSEPSSSDPNITVTTVIIPIATLNEAQQTLQKFQKAYTEARSQTESLIDKGAADEEINAQEKREKQLEQEVEQAENLLKQLTSLEIYAEGTNRLSIDFSDVGPRSKRCYAVLPLVIEKNVFVTQCSSFMSEGGKLFGMRKYKEAKAAYENAWNAEDVIASMRPAIRESMAQCDTCMLYENLAARSIKRIAELKKSGNATQDEVAKYASAAIEFMQMVHSYNPDEFYSTRIERMKHLLEGMPLLVKFTIVEWKTLQEGNYLPDVEVWAYHGFTPPSPGSLSSDKRFEKILEKEKHNYKQIGTSDGNGIAEVELDRTNLPEGLLFRPKEDSRAKIKYMSMAELMRHAYGTYMEKQFRLKMYTK